MQEIAPLATWAFVLGSTALFVCGFVTVSHALCMRRAYGERFDGALARGTLESMVRWSGALLGAALLLAGLALEWPAALLAILGVIAAASLVLEVLSRVRA